MIYKHIHDIARVEAIIDRFVEFVSAQPDYDTAHVSRYLDHNEGYKPEVYVKATDILNYKSWKKPVTQVDQICQAAKEAMRFQKNNFVYKSQKISFVEKIEQEPVKSATALFDFFKTNNDEENLETLVKCFGRRYDTLSYLFFLKDPDNYFPCRPTKFLESFKMLDMDTECCGPFTWGNYTAYNEAIKELALVYSNHAGHINALEAHSFAWMISQYPGIKAYILQERVDDDAEKREGNSRRKTRLNQTEFRTNVVECWGGRCAVTGCSLTDILEASHIKGYSECKTRNECVSADNGLLLTPNLHTLFDAGLISFAEDGRIMISDRLSEEDKRILRIDENMKLRIVDPGREKYLKEHREKVFW